MICCRISDVSWIRVQAMHRLAERGHRVGQGAMTAAAPQRTTVRSHVADQTRAIHNALHENAVLRQLTAPDITQPQYRHALRVLSCFYNAVERERQRTAEWHGFALGAECSALARDLGENSDPAISLSFENRFELLGGLYVAHGASFGRTQFRRNLEQALPDVSRHFVDLRMNKDVWRSLTSRMEEDGQAETTLKAMVSGASRSFHAVEMTSQTLHAQASGFSVT